MPNLAKIESLENKIRHFYISDSIYGVRLRFEAWISLKRLTFKICSYFGKQFTLGLKGNTSFCNQSVDGRNLLYSSILIIKINDFSCGII